MPRTKQQRPRHILGSSNGDDSELSSEMDVASDNDEVMARTPSLEKDNAHQEAYIDESPPADMLQCDSTDRDTTESRHGDSLHRNTATNSTITEESSSNDPDADWSAARREETGVESSNGFRKELSSVNFLVRPPKRHCDVFEGIKPGKTPESEKGNKVAKVDVSSANEYSRNKRGEDTTLDREKFKDDIAKMYSDPQMRNSLQELMLNPLQLMTNLFLQSTYQKKLAEKMCRRAGDRADEDRKHEIASGASPDVKDCNIEKDGDNDGNEVNSECPNWASKPVTENATDKSSLKKLNDLQGECIPQISVTSEYGSEKTKNERKEEIYIIGEVETNKKNKEKQGLRNQKHPESSQSDSPNKYGMGFGLGHRYPRFPYLPLSGIGTPIAYPSLPAFPGVHANASEFRPQVSYGSLDRYPLYQSRGLTQAPEVVVSDGGRDSMSPRTPDGDTAVDKSHSQLHIQRRAIQHSHNIYSTTSLPVGLPLLQRQLLHGAAYHRHLTSPKHSPRSNTKASRVFESISDDTRHQPPVAFTALPNFPGIPGPGFYDPWSLIYPPMPIGPIVNTPFSNGMRADYNRNLSAATPSSRNGSSISPSASSSSNHDIRPSSAEKTSRSKISHANPIDSLHAAIVREAKEMNKGMDPENMYIECPICNKKIKRLYHFQRHMRIHSGEKSHKCEYCPYKSVRKDNLKSHMKTHEKNKHDTPKRTQLRRDPDGKMGYHNDFRRSFENRSIRDRQHRSPADLSSPVNSLSPAPPSAGLPPNIFPYIPAPMNPKSLASIPPYRNSLLDAASSSRQRSCFSPVYGPNHLVGQAAAGLNEHQKATYGYQEIPPFLAVPPVFFGRPFQESIFRDEHRPFSARIAELPADGKDERRNEMGNSADVNHTADQKSLVESDGVSEAKFKPIKVESTRQEVSPREKTNKSPSKKERYVDNTPPRKRLDTGFPHDGSAEVKRRKYIEHSVPKKPVKGEFPSKNENNSSNVPTMPNSIVRLPSNVTVTSSFQTPEVNARIEESQVPNRDTPCMWEKKYLLNAPPVIQIRTEIENGDEKRELQPPGKTAQVKDALEGDKDIWAMSTSSDEDVYRRYSFPPSVQDVSTLASPSDKHCSVDSTTTKITYGYSHNTSSDEPRVALTTGIPSLSNNQDLKTHSDTRCIEFNSSNVDDINSVEQVHSGTEEKNYHVEVDDAESETTSRQRRCPEAPSVAGDNTNWLWSTHIGNCKPAANRVDEPRDVRLSPPNEFSAPTSSSHVFVPSNREFRCRLCEFVCLSNSLLQEHMATHKEDGLYKCQQCDYHGKNLSKLIEHIRIHTGERPFRCDQCSYAAKRKDNLAQHKSVRHDKNRYKGPARVLKLSIGHDVMDSQDRCVEDDLLAKYLNRPVRHIKQQVAGDETHGISQKESKVAVNSNVEAGTPANWFARLSHTSFASLPSGCDGHGASTKIEAPVGSNDFPKQPSILQPYGFPSSTNITYDKVTPSFLFGHPLTTSSLTTRRRYGNRESTREADIDFFTSFSPTIATTEGAFAKTIQQCAR